MRQLVFAFLFLTLLCGTQWSALAETGTDLERRVHRILATPTPAGPFVIASDQSSWRVDVPAHSVVTVEARGKATAPFYLKAERMDSGPSSALFPATHLGVILHESGAWRVSIDPASGVDVDVMVRFRGHVASSSGAPAPFTLTNLTIDRGCIVPSACLP